MKVKTIVAGPIGVNCYIVKDEDTGIGVIIDPGGNAAEIIQTARLDKIQVKYVINTHGHSDHIGANTEVCEAFGAKLLIHEADKKMLTDGRANLSFFMGMTIISKSADEYIKNGDVIEFGNCKLKVLHTPGHSEGGICLVTDGIVFSGDTLFAESIGRCDFPGGSEITLIRSIKEKLMTLPDDTKVLPGHGPATTIGWERKCNPYLQF